MNLDTVEDLMNSEENTITNTRVTSYKEVLKELSKTTWIKTDYKSRFNKIAIEVIFISSHALGKEVSYADLYDFLGDKDSIDHLLKNALASEKLGGLESDAATDLLECDEYHFYKITSLVARYLYEFATELPEMNGE